MLRLIVTALVILMVFFDHALWIMSFLIEGSIATMLLIALWWDKIKLMFNR